MKQLSVYLTREEIVARLASLDRRVDLLTETVASLAAELEQERRWVDLREGSDGGAPGCGDSARDGYALARSST